eukprot:NODE_2300_length_630_cov_298.888124_g1950_i0.p1 GENE.NODE_2300_length_630_cov_298.888124_g1950_i0~~NODE_2300_length_630_cov_298.888124_g1950_i0.p1  ORF type:complete len:166 (+),score=13.87 NODE_2300_length_630_cov_298.888124_g1950_i0:34-531(+)
MGTMNEDETPLENPTPVIHEVKRYKRAASNAGLEKEDEREPIDPLEVFELIRHIKDPEHPNTLEELKVTEIEGISVNDVSGELEVLFTPTIPHCTMSTLIGLSIRVKLMRSLPNRMKIRVGVTPGTHYQEEQLNKQLNDKERVAAALENDHLLGVVDQCLYSLSS